VINEESKRRDKREAGRMTVTRCGAQVDSLKKLSILLDLIYNKLI